MKTKKITQTSLLMTSLILVSLVPVTAFAADGDVTLAKSGTTQATVKVVAGDLTASGFKDVSFPEIQVGKIWTEAYDNNQSSENMTIHVEDFTGVPNSSWVVSVNAGTWAPTTEGEGIPGSAQGAEALNAKAKLSVNGTKFKGDTAIKVFQGQSGIYDTTEANTPAFNLAIDQGTDVKAGSYTNTLTWSISNTVAADGE